MIRKTATLVRDSRGAALTEFALILPVLITLLLGVLNMGVYFFAKNSVENAIDEVARDAAIFPTPSQSEMQTIFDDELLKTEASGTVTLSIQNGTSSNGTKYVDLSTSYSIPVNLVFVDLGSIPARAERRVYLPE